MVSQITTITRLLLPTQFHPTPDTFPSPSIYFFFFLPSFPHLLFTFFLAAFLLFSRFTNTQRVTEIMLYSTWEYRFGIDHGGILLKGTGSRDRIKIFCQKWINGSLRTSTGFLTLKVSHWWAVVFAIFQVILVKTYGRNGIFWSLLPNYFGAFLFPTGIIRWTVDFCWFIVQIKNNILVGKSLLEDRRTLSGVQVWFASSQNPLECRKGPFKTLLESVYSIEWFWVSLHEYYFSNICSL